MTAYTPSLAVDKDLVQSERIVLTATRLTTNAQELRLDVLSVEIKAITLANPFCLGNLSPFFAIF